MGSNVTGINAGTANNDDSNRGLYFLAALEIFEILEQPQYRHINVHVSLFEIYGGGKVRLNLSLSCSFVRVSVSV
jgi:hypothetical protein